MQLNLRSVLSHKDDEAAHEAPKRLVSFLTRSPGLPYCAECLAHELGIGPDRVRRAFGELRQTLARLREERRWCARCLRWAEVVSVEAP